jgi:hypothetical protein
MCKHASDYFENTRRATYIQQHTRCAIREASKAMVNTSGVSPRATVLDQRAGRSAASCAGSTTTARGVPSGPDDGTLAPWAVVASLPFAPSSFCRRSNILMQRFPR